METHKDLEVFIENGVQKFYENGVKFKILGKLSPNITWEIKDGDEIEVERDYPLILIPDHSIHAQDMDFQKRVKKEQSKAMHHIYKVKCPTCNTYH